MATFNLRGKTITVSDNDVKLMKDKMFFEFDERDLIGLIAPVLTTGNLNIGLQTPDIDNVISTSSEKQLSDLVAQGISLHRRMIE